MSKLFSPKQESNSIKEPVINNVKKLDKTQGIDSNLDINLVIAGFQEKLNQLMTENIVKDATIKQLVKTIEKLKEQL